MRVIRAIHDLAVALLAGGIAGGSLSAIVLFRKAPTREVAGEVGQAIFDLLGIVVLSLSIVLLASRILLQREETPSWKRSTALALSVICAAAACVIALWLTPAMGAIWESGPHAADGSGLAGDARASFMRLHGMANLSYLILLLSSAGMILLRPGPGSVPK